VYEHCSENGKLHSAMFMHILLPHYTNKCTEATAADQSACYYTFFTNFICNWLAIWGK